MPVQSVKARVSINLEYETNAMKILKRIDVKQPQHITLSGRYGILNEGDGSGHLIIRVKVDKQLYEELQQYCEEYT